MRLPAQLTLLAAVLAAAVPAHAQTVASSANLKLKQLASQMTLGIGVLDR